MSDYPERSVLVGLDGLPHIVRNAWLVCGRSPDHRCRTSLPWEPGFVPPPCGALENGEPCGGKLTLGLSSNVNP